MNFRLLRRLGFYLAIAAPFISLLYITWNKWGCLVIDSFRDPWVSYKVMQGKVLYRDVFYSFGFFPPYLISLLYKIFGVNLKALIYTGIIITAASYILVYKISRLFLNRAFSFLSALTFLSVFAFGFYRYNNIFNFILPYSLPSTFFSVFTLFALYFYIKFIRSGIKKYLFGWMASIYLAFLSRPDLSFSAWAIFLLLALVTIVKKNKKYRLAIYMLLPFLMAGFSYWLFLFTNNAFAGFKESIIDYFFSYTSREHLIYSLSLGANQLLLSLKISLKSFFCQLIAVFLLFLWSRRMSVLNVSAKRTILIYLITALMAFSVALVTLKIIGYPYQYRSMPIILILGLFLTGRYLSFLIIFSVALVLIARVFLRVSPNYFGFFLSPAGLICYYIFFVEICLLWFNKFFKSGPAVRRYYLVSLFIFFLVSASACVRHSYMNYKEEKFISVTERGGMVSFDDGITKSFWEAVAYLKDTPVNSTLVVFPEGVGLNFFSNRDNPLKYIAFIPPDLKVAKEKTILDQLIEQRVDYIAILGRDTSEFGYASFGIDYAKDIYLWITTNYRLVKVIGNYPFRSRAFGIAIFERI